MIPPYLAPLANHLWQSTIYALIVGLLAMALRKNCAAVRYKLWLAASMKFLVPFSLLVSVGSQVQWRSVAPVATPPLSFAMTEISQPFASVAAPAIHVSAKTPDRVPIVLFCIWFMGGVVSLAPWFSQWRRIRRTLRAANPLHWDLPIRAMSCPGNAEPGVFGIFRPVLLLPDGIADRLTPSELQAILSHELCHVRRRDNLSALVHMAVEFLFWFYPLVWWIGKRLTEEQENACDEEVLRLGSDPQVYAEGILKVCRLYLESPLACVAKVTGSDLRKRIEAIMRDGAALKLNLGKKFLLATVGVVAVALPIVVGLLNAPQTRAQSAVAEGRRAAFEVVSIKPCEDPRQHQERGGAYPPRGNSSPGRLSTGCFPLLDNNGVGLIRSAYASNPFTPINGGPSWIHSAFYEINATAEGTPSVRMMMGPMMQVLLEGHFQFKVHPQTTEGPVYFLSVARGGPKLHSFTEGSCTPYSSAAQRPLQPGQEYCESLISAIPPASVKDQGTTLDDFSKQLLAVLDRPVINKTGIAGRFDIHIEFSREGTKMAGMPLVQPPGGKSPDSDPTGPPSIFTAIQEQLGLKLESGKGPVEMLLIDHIERPKENEATNGFETSSPLSAALAKPVAQAASVPQKKPTGILSQISPKAQPQQQAATPLSFEVASIKPSAGLRGGFGGFAGPSIGGTLTVTNSSVKTMLCYAFQLQDFQIVGGAHWIESEQYDTTAKIEGPPIADPLARQSRARLMFQTLLAERFKLTLHRETKEVAGYELIVAKGGHKLKAPTGEDLQLPTFGEPTASPVKLGLFNTNTAEGSGITGAGQSMAQLAGLLADLLHSAVVDATGLTGSYDFSVKGFERPGTLVAATSATEPARRDIFAALQEQLGLKLQARKVPTEILVIDHVEKPTGQ